MFSDLQKRIISWALTGVALLLLAGLLVFVIILGSQFLSVFGNVIWPIFIALVLALLVQPISNLLVQKCKFPPSLAAGTMLLGVLAILALILFIVLPQAIRQISEFAAILPAIWDGALQKYPDFAEWFANVSQFFTGENLAANFAVPAQEVLQKLLPKLGVIWQNASSIFSAIAAFAMVPICFFYFVAEQHDFIGKISKESAAIFPRHIADNIGFLLKEFRDIIVAYFRGQLIVVTCYGAILAVGFLVCGLPSALLLGFGLGYLNMIPYLGTVVGLCIVFPLAFFSGGLPMLIGVFVVFCVAQLVEAYFLTPKIMNSYTGLHPLVVLISVFFWGIALKGILGMVLAVPLTAFFVIFWRLLKRDYLGVPDESAGTSAGTEN